MLGGHGGHGFGRVDHDLNLIILKGPRDSVDDVPGPDAGKIVLDGASSVGAYECRDEVEYDIHGGRCALILMETLVVAGDVESKKACGICAEGGPFPAVAHDAFYMVFVDWRERGVGAWGSIHWAP